MYFIIIIGLGIMLYQGNQSNPGGVNKEVDYTTFRNYVKQGVAKEVVVNKTEGNVRMVVRPEKFAKSTNRALTKREALRRFRLNTRISTPSMAFWMLTIREA